MRGIRAALLIISAALVLAACGGTRRPPAPACTGNCVVFERGSGTIRGTYYAPLVIRTGHTITFAPGARMVGDVTVEPGASLVATGARIEGNLAASGAGSVRLCDSTIFGTIRVSASRGLVAFGADHGRPACLGNQIEGTVVITGNTAGVEFDGNSVVGPVTITANSGKVTPPGTGAVQAISNTITGGAVNVQH